MNIFHLLEFGYMSTTHTIFQCVLSIYFKFSKGIKIFRNYINTEFAKHIFILKQLQNKIYIKYIFKCV